METESIFVPEELCWQNRTSEKINQPSGHHLQIIITIYIYFKGLFYTFICYV